ncbi:MAG: outer membrane protein assembly factor BamB [Woeseia sp.]|nr:outer membrane protein assembly factor BamB [Woeseia sp.]
MISTSRLVVLLLAVSALSGCSLFGGKDDKELEPKELESFEQTLELKRLWQAKVGGGSEYLRLALMPAGDGKRIYAAAYDGVVSAFDPESGRRLWRIKTDARLSAGPSLSDGRVIVGGVDGDLIALSSETGEEDWRRDIGGEVLAPPVAKDDLLVVYTIDGKLHVLSAFDGSERWSLEKSLPPLTLRGSSVPVVVGASVIAGFDNGRIVATNLLDGVTEWEVVLSPPSGRSDLERLSDIDGTISAVGQDVYASGYQGQIAALAAESGQLLWEREISSYAGVSADWNNVYTTTDTGEVVALARRSGTESWRNDSLLRRDPTLPVPFDRAVAVGDFDGYVHFLSNIDGDVIARKRVGKGRISGTPVVIGSVLYVQSENGSLSAFTVPQRAAPAEASDEN